MPHRPARRGPAKRMSAPLSSDFIVLSDRVDIESSSDSDDSSRSTSYAGPSRMTHRQAALAGMVEATELVSLGLYLSCFIFSGIHCQPSYLCAEETTSKKKKHLNEAELALKREETARKRKNLSVKKLEDEKAGCLLRVWRKMY